MSQYKTWYHPYPINPDYDVRVAYFSMEFGIHQALKTYSGGLGFLSGSHMRSGFDLKQNLIGLGILWKYGYYDQLRNEDLTLRVHFQKKFYTFLEDTGIIVDVVVNGHPVMVKAMVLKPEVFGTVPVYFLTTDLPENDYLARTITHRLYDPETPARIAQSIVLGIGGAKVVDALGGADIYHLNEGHGLPVTFHLLDKFRDLAAVKKLMVFTTHTPEKAGNEVHNFDLLYKMGFFGNLTQGEVSSYTGAEGPMFDYSLAALRLSKLANGVSQLHGEVSRAMWQENEGIAEIKAITNAQNVRFWADRILLEALDKNDDEALLERKARLKEQLFEVVADQTGNIFRPEVLTIVWARRFAGYKRADLLVRNISRFLELTNRTDRPVQVIWAGKPYPFDKSAIEVFDKLVKLAYQKKNFAVLTGYEIDLSAKLKKGSDLWLNTPRRPREASGTSGMTAAMNGSINFSVQDGWIPEMSELGQNSFLLPVIDSTLPESVQDDLDYANLMQILEGEIIPTYYEDKPQWLELMKKTMRDVTPHFNSDRMADEYYRIMYKG